MKRQTEVVTEGWVAWCDVCGADVYAAQIEDREDVGESWHRMLSAGPSRVLPLPDWELRVLPCNHTRTDSLERSGGRLFTMQFAGRRPAPDRGVPVRRAWCALWGHRLTRPRHGVTLGTYSASARVRREVDGGGAWVDVWREVILEVRHCACEARWEPTVAARERVLEVLAPGEELVEDLKVWAR